MSTVESRFEWATRQRAKLCPVQNAFALETIDACVSAFERGGKPAASDEFKSRINSRKDDLPLWVAGALKDIILGLIRA